MLIWEKRGNKLKKLLLLFSLLLTSNSYGEWTELAEGDGFKTYLDLDTINIRDDYIYWWVMFSNNSDSAQVFFQGDCKLMADKVLESLTYERSMGQGVSKSVPVLPPFKSTWTYLPPNGQRTEFLKLVCGLEDQYPKQQLKLINSYKEYLEKQKEEQRAYEEYLANREEIEAEKQREFEKEYNYTVSGGDSTDEIIIEKGEWVRTVAELVSSNWRYQGAEDDWNAEVYIVQDRDGTIVAVDVRNSNVGNSSKAKVFEDSIRRAVYKSSPLPRMDDAYFDKEFLFIFNVN